MTPRGRTMKPQSWIVLKPQTSVVPTFNTRSVCVLVSVQGVDASATFPDRAEALSSEDTVLGGCTGSPEWEWFYLYSLSIFSELLCKQRSGLSLLASHTDVGPPPTVGSLTDWQHPGDLPRPAHWLKQRADSYRVRAGQPALILWFPL